MKVVFRRLFAKLFHLESLLVDNSTDRAYIEIDLNNLEHNVKTLKKAMPPKCRLMAVVKAQAYGHGAYEISTHLEKIGVGAFAVATIDEGISLRKYGIRGEILILGYTDPARAKDLKKYDLIQTLVDFAHASALNGQRIPIKAHIKVDTGMHRLGLASSDTAQAEQIFAMKYIKVCGIYTHLCCADSLLAEDVAFTKEQITKFYSFVGGLEASGISVPKLHIQSSYGLMNYPELACDYVRAGIALYGVLSTADRAVKQELDLRPVLSLKAKVILVRRIPEGDSVGYGRSYVADRDMKIALLPIGYGDGFPRNLSGKNAYVMIRQQAAPIIGLICMDLLMVNVTDIAEVAVGDIGTLLGEGELQTPAVAGSADSISNELLCRLGKRLPRICTF